MSAPDVMFPALRVIDIAGGFLGVTLGPNLFHALPLLAVSLLTFDVWL